MSTPPDKMAQSTLADSHKVANMGAQMHAAALSKLAPMLAQLGQSGASSPDTGQGDPSQGGQNPDDQAVWNEFPSTDPQTVGQLMQAGDPTSAFQQFMQLAEQDEESFHQKQMQALAAMLAGLSAPAGPPQPDQAQQGPAVGGDAGQAPY